MAKDSECVNGKKIPNCHEYNGEKMGKCRGINKHGRPIAVGGAETMTTWGQANQQGTKGFAETPPRVGGQKMVSSLGRRGSSNSCLPRGRVG